MLPWIGQEMEELYTNDAYRVLYFEVTVLQITLEEDYKLFEHIKEDNVEAAIKILNGVSVDIAIQDEYHQTPLMASLGSQLLQITATILNKKPKEMR